MLDREPLSEVLRIVRGVLVGMQAGDFAQGPEQGQRVISLVGECIARAEALELEAGVADPVTRLRSAGGNVLALRAALRGMQ